MAVLEDLGDDGDEGNVHEPARGETEDPFRATLYWGKVCGGGLTLYVRTMGCILYRVQRNT